MLLCGEAAGQAACCWQAHTPREYPIRRGCRVKVETEMRPFLRAPANPATTRGTRRPHTGVCIVRGSVLRGARYTRRSVNQGYRPGRTEATCTSRGSAPRRQALALVQSRHSRMAPSRHQPCKPLVRKGLRGQIRQVVEDRGQSRRRIPIPFSHLHLRRNSPANNTLTSPDCFLILLVVSRRFAGFLAQFWDSSWAGNLPPNLS